MRATLSLAAAGAALAFALPLHAQNPVIRLGQTVSGQLTAADPRLEDASHYDLYTFRGRAGERVTFTLRSGNFDAFLAFGRMRGGTFDAASTDDDGAGTGTDARLTVVIDDDGEYLVRANSLGKGETGAYTLTAEAGGAAAPSAAPQPPARISGTLALGQTVRGTLGAGDAVMDDDSYFDLYRFTGRPGTRVEIVMRSTAFDSYLAVGQLRDGVFDAGETDDDGAGGQDARLRVTVPASGEIVVRANSLGGGETGAYTLSLTSAPAAPPAPAPQAIRVGQTVSGTLSAGDAMEDDESYYDAYVIEGSAGERLRITMRSTAFDAYLNFGRGLGEAFESSSTDDDSGGEMDAQLDVTLPSSGRYVIRANSLGANQTGSYTLTVARP